MRKAKIVKATDGEPVSFLDDTHLIKLTGTDTNDEVTVDLQSYKKASGSEAHVHERDSHIFYVTEGSFQLVVDGTEFSLSVGDLAYIPKGISHSFSAFEIEGATALVVTLPAGLENLFRALEGADAIEAEKIAARFGVHRPRQSK